MAKFNWVQTFLSLEGECILTGYPTVYARLASCNMECKGFNNKGNLDVTDPMVIGFNPKDYTNIKDLPAISIGCDSRYSHGSEYKHLWKSGTEDDLAKEIVGLLPNQCWKSPTGLSYAWSITGGEPSLHWKTIPALLNHPLMAGCKTIIFETNCSVAFKDKFVEDIVSWLEVDEERKWVWSNSPKLSCSGELREKSIQPEIAVKQIDVPESVSSRVVQYFKFVVSTLEDISEVEEVMDMYYQAGISKNTLVSLMPEACLQEQQDGIAKQVAQWCIEKGYHFSYRLQNTLWGNDVNT